MQKYRSTLDRFDMKLLQLVQVSNRTPQHVLAEEVGLSAPAIARRLQKLREQGVIQKDMAIIDAAAVGRPLTIIVQVTVEDESFALLDEIKERFRRCEQILHCHYVTGGTDFVLIVNVRDMEEYTQFTRTQFFELGNVKSFQTYVSMECIKANEGIPLDLE
ncbi:Lrp/AsnC family transcriptional regulator [Pelagibacterium lacus]|uniref:Lrp/AsnC family transcriptional regulator n=1 Tax=Pelagibacterium lacus TaxID=2282655 RepID=A0A369VZT1_9HYPH|nr:Lrp/AsnC family transcriptional regulator [Pelagibacterium lacus]RDE07818.1 Lrp/AsnC family transcriptional regulator [Pelagibacterium lacus]